METLLAVVLFFGVLTAAATAYRAAEKRSSNRTSVTQPTEPPVSYGIGTPSPSVDATVPPITPTESPQKASEASPTPDVSPAVTAPIMPDPWAVEEMTPPQESPVSVANTGTGKPLTFTEVSDRPDLSATIDRIGQSGQMQQVANLQRYANHPDSKVRASVATALGRLAANKPGNSVEGLVPVLGKLSQDGKPEVRLAAIQALGNIRSPKVLPWLQQAQRTASGEVGQAVNVALQNLKLIYHPKPKAPVNPRVSQFKSKK